MASSVIKDNILQPTTLQEANNYIKFLSTSHQQEIKKLKKTLHKQAEVIKKLESNRKQELEFLARELHNYEINLAVRTESVTKQLAQKDEIISKQAEIIEELNRKLKLRAEDFIIPGITLGDSNSDSGVAMDDSNIKTEEAKTEVKPTRKCSRRFADSISFLRRVDFSPMKYKPSNREPAKKKEEIKKTLEVPTINKRLLMRQYSNDRPTSDDDRAVQDDSVLSDGPEPILIRPKHMNDSMNNHFSDDGSEDTSEEIFDRVMTRSSIRRSVKANPKYKKINRTKGKLLEHIKLNIVD